jgi:hypothetical protein
MVDPTQNHWYLDGTRLYTLVPQDVLSNTDDGQYVKGFLVDVSCFGETQQATRTLAKQLQLLLNAQNSGAGLILAQRLRDQIQYDAAHDDQHNHVDLMVASQAYLEVADYHVFGEECEVPVDYERSRRKGLRYWPWEVEGFKPTADPVRALMKAGSLLAAAIDRLLRRRQSHPAPLNFPTAYFSSQQTYQAALGDAHQAIKRGEAPPKTPQLD